MKQLITNIVIIAVISAAVAFFITRQSGGAETLTMPAAPSGENMAPGLVEKNGDLSGTNVARQERTAEPSEGGYKLETGPLAVTEVSSIVLHDEKRNKDLHVRVFYPVTAGKYPVIIFSHGAAGSGNCCESLTRHWASYGYITIQPTHDDSLLQRRNDNEDGSFLPAVREALKDPVRWESRAQDITFILDSLSDLQKRIGGLSGKVDANRIGVAGHSMGSFTAEAMGGALVNLPGRVATNFSDSRVKAILCLSPQGPGQFGLSEHSFDKISLPYMGITGSLDSLGPSASPAWHKIPYERSQAGDKYELFITGARHMSFITDQTGTAGRSSQAAAILGYTNSASLAFFDAYLKGDASAKQFLETDALERYSHGAAKLSRR